MLRMFLDVAALTLPLMVAAARSTTWFDPGAGLR
jgi:hypothetical protein